MTQVVFAGSACTVQVGRYANGQTRIALVDEEGPVATATSAVEGVELKPDEVLLKDFSENRGIVAALVAAGVVDEPTSWVEAGYARLARCRLRTR